MAKRLSERGIARVRPAATRIEIPDAVVPGLRLVVQPSGRKSWAVRTRLRGKPAKITLGSWPALGVAEARDKAGGILKLAGRGEDPRVARRRAVAESVEAVVTAWLERDQAGNRTAPEVARTLAREVLPHWRDRPLSSITRQDCMAVIDAIADRGTITAARRLHAHLHRLFRWSVGRGLIAINPMLDLPKPGAERPRDRVLSDAELARVWEAAGALGWPFGPAIRLLMLTAARREEIGALRWSEIDAGEAVIRLAGDRTKTGEPRTIPLAAPALAILAGLPRIGDEGGLVFTGSGRTPISGWSRAKRRLDVLAGVEDWRLHDLRRTAATGLQRLGFRLEVIEAVLGHLSGSRAGIVGVYQRHSYDPEKRRALDAWAAHVLALAEDRGEAAAANVVALAAIRPPA